MTNTPENLLSLEIATLAASLLARRWRLVTAESCTGGLLAKYFTDQAGSSQWYEGGWVTYSNAMKQQQLQVSAHLLAHFGAVSEPVVLAMAHGALQNTAAQLSIAVSGVAGPEGGTPNKPVGTVWFAWGIRGASSQVIQTHAQRMWFAGDRSQIRAAAVKYALKGIREYL